MTADVWLKSKKEWALGWESCLREYREDKKQYGFDLLTLYSISNTGNYCGNIGNSLQYSLVVSPRTHCTHSCRSSTSS